MKSLLSPNVLKFLGVAVAGAAASLVDSHLLSAQIVAVAGSVLSFILGLLHPAPKA